MLEGRLLSRCMKFWLLTLVIGLARPVGASRDGFEMQENSSEHTGNTNQTTWPQLVAKVKSSLLQVASNASRVKHAMASSRSLANSSQQLSENGTAGEAIWPDMQDFNDVTDKISCMHSWIEQYGMLKQDTNLVELGLAQIKQAEDLVHQLDVMGWASVFNTPRVADIASEKGVTNALWVSKNLLQRLHAASAEYHSRLTKLMPTARVALESGQVPCGGEDANPPEWLNNLTENLALDLGNLGGDGRKEWNPDDHIKEWFGTLDEEQAAENLKARRNELERQKSRAVEHEDYEGAAKARDALRRLDDSMQEMHPRSRDQEEISDTLGSGDRQSSIIGSSAPGDLEGSHSSQESDIAQRKEVFASSIDKVKEKFSRGVESHEEDLLQRTSSSQESSGLTAASRPDSDSLDRQGPFVSSIDAAKEKIMRGQEERDLAPQGSSRTIDTHRTVPDIADREGPFVSSIDDVKEKFRRGVESHEEDLLGSTKSGQESSGLTAAGRSDSDNLDRQRPFVSSIDAAKEKIMRGQEEGDLAPQGNSRNESSGATDTRRTVPDIADREGPFVASIDDAVAPLKITDQRKLPPPGRSSDIAGGRVSISSSFPGVTKSPVGYRDLGSLSVDVVLGKPDQDNGLGPSTRKDIGSKLHSAGSELSRYSEIPRLLGQASSKGVTAGQLRDTRLSDQSRIYQLGVNKTIDSQSGEWPEKALSGARQTQMRSADSGSSEALATLETQVQNMAVLEQALTSAVLRLQKGAAAIFPPQSPNISTAEPRLVMSNSSLRDEDIARLRDQIQRMQNAVSQLSVVRSAASSSVVMPVVTSNLVESNRTFVSQALASLSSQVEQLSRQVSRMTSFLPSSASDQVPVLSSDPVRPFGSFAVPGTSDPIIADYLARLVDHVARMSDQVKQSLSAELHGDASEITRSPGPLGSNTSFVVESLAKLSDQVEKMGADIENLLSKRAVMPRSHDAQALAFTENTSRAPDTVAALSGQVEKLSGEMQNFMVDMSTKMTDVTGTVANLGQQVEQLRAHRSAGASGGDPSPLLSDNAQAGVIVQGNNARIELVGQGTDIRPHVLLPSGDAQPDQDLPPIAFVSGSPYSGSPFPLPQWPGNATRSWRPREPRLRGDRDVNVIASAAIHDVIEWWKRKQAPQGLDAFGKAAQSESDRELGQIAGSSGVMPSERDAALDEEPDSVGQVRAQLKNLGKLLSQMRGSSVVKPSGQDITSDVQSESESLSSKEALLKELHDVLSQIPSAISGMPSERAGELDTVTASVGSVRSEQESRSGSSKEALLKQLHDMLSQVPNAIGGMPSEREGESDAVSGSVASVSSEQEPGSTSSNEALLKQIHDMLNQMSSAIAGMPSEREGKHDAVSSSVGPVRSEQESGSVSSKEARLKELQDVLSKVPSAISETPSDREGELDEESESVGSVKSKEALLKKLNDLLSQMRGSSLVRPSEADTTGGTASESVSETSQRAMLKKFEDLLGQIPSAIGVMPSEDGDHDTLSDKHSGDTRKNMVLKSRKDVMPSEGDHERGTTSERQSANLLGQIPGSSDGKAVVLHHSIEIIGPNGSKLSIGRQAPQATQGTGTPSKQGIDLVHYSGSVEQAGDTLAFGGSLHGVPQISHAFGSVRSGHDRSLEEPRANIRFQLPPDVAPVTSISTVAKDSQRTGPSSAGYVDEALSRS